MPPATHVTHLAGMDDTPTSSTRELLPRDSSQPVFWSLGNVGSASLGLHVHANLPALQESTARSVLDRNVSLLHMHSDGLEIRRRDLQRDPAIEVRESAALFDRIAECRHRRSR